MRKYLIILLLFVSCQRSPDALNINPELNVASVSYPPLGDQNRVTDLYIPVNENDWAGDTSYHVGIAAQDPVLRLTGGKWYLRYVCPIANAAPQSWSTLYQDYSGGDLVIDKAREGVWDSVRHQWDFPGLIAIDYYVKGRRFSTYNKVEYNVGNGLNKDDFDPSKERFYQWPDTMYISGRSADVYGNLVEVPSTNGTPNVGYGVVKVWINPYKRVNESNYDNNVSVLPVRISSGNISVVDYAAIADNKPVPVDNFSGQYIGQGNPKKVILNWNPDREEVKIFRDGTLLADDIYDSTYTVTVPANFKQSTFSIIKVIDGLGESNPVSITVKK